MFGQQVGESREQVRRYISLTELIPEILDMVDEGQIALRPAVELSYLPKEQQEDLAESIGMEQCTPTHAQAIRTRREEKMAIEKQKQGTLEVTSLDDLPSQRSAARERLGAR